MNFLDSHHIVQGWVHQDINGAGIASDIISLKNYNHVTIVLDFGNTTAGGDADVAIVACDDVAGTRTKALSTFSYRKGAASTSDDSFAAAVEVTDSKLDYVAGGEIVPNTDDNKLVVIDLDGAAIRAADDDYEYDCLKVTFGNPGQGCPVGCKFILSQPRFAGPAMPSAIVD
jgi:hypothetical protein